APAPWAGESETSTVENVTVTLVEAAIPNLTVVWPGTKLVPFTVTRVPPVVKPPAGIVPVIWVAVLAPIATVAVPIVTLVAFERFVPVIVIEVPPASEPAFGVIMVNVGALPKVKAAKAVTVPKGVVMT